MYLVDTDALSVLRKGEKADLDVRKFFEEICRSRTPLYLSVVTLGEIGRGVEIVRQFSVTMCTVFERFKIPRSEWLLAAKCFAPARRA